MVRAILGMFTTEQKIETILSHSVIEFIFMALFIIFILAIFMHLLLYLHLRPIRNHLHETGRMDVEPLRIFKEDFEQQSKVDSVQVETFVQEKFSNWRFLHIPIVHLIKVIQATISIFILLGVLGTFIGLTISLGSIDTSSDQFVENAANVLSGIDVAFYTSIIGMSFSLLMTLLVNLLNTEYMLTDVMLMVESHLSEENEHGVGKLVHVSESIHESIVHLQETNQTALQQVVQAFTGFQEYTSGLEQSAKDLKEFNDGLSENLVHFQQLFTHIKEVTDGLGEGTNELNENFTELFAYLKQGEQRSEHYMQVVEDINKQMKETALTQTNANSTFAEFAEDLQEFLASALQDQSTIHQSFDQLISKSDQLVRTMENHHQEFKDVFGQNISGGLEEIEIHLQSLSKDFDHLGATLTQFPQAFEEINETQNEYRQLLSNRFRDMDEFNQTFGNYLREHGKESAQMERNMREASTTFEQIGSKNSQLFQEINQSLTQIDQVLSQRENQLERNVDFLQDTLTDYMRNMTETLENRLNQVIYQLDETMKRTGEEIQREFMDVQRMNEEALQNNARLMQQFIQEIGREMQGLNRNINSQQTIQQSGLNQNDL